MDKVNYKRGKQYYTPDMFDNNFDGYADVKYNNDRQKSIESIKKIEEEKIKKEKEAKEADKKFWEKHPNDGWLF